MKDIIKLAESGVILNEDHQYLLGDLQLKGITGIIQEKICPDKYAGVSDELLQARAKEGSNIHSALEMYDMFGTIDEKYSDIVEQWRERKEADGIEVLANEYIVTDGIEYASPIDKVVVKDGKVYLADVKTTSALDREYCGWQLSVYKSFFQKMNPSIAVAGLLVLHISKGEMRFVEVTDKGEAAVIELLYTENLPSVDVNQDHAMMIIESLSNLIERKQELEGEIKRFDEQLRQLLEPYPPFKLENSRFTLSKGEDYERSSIDSKALKEAEPAIYDKFLKVTKVAGRISYKMKTT